MKIHFLKSFSLAVLAMFFASFSSASFAGLADIEVAILKKDYAQAERLARDLLAQKQTKSSARQAHYYLGLSQLKQGRYQEARDSFLKLDTNESDAQLREKARLGIFDSHYFEENYEQAYDTLKQLLRARIGHESTSLIYLKMARANLKLARWSEAHDYLEKIVRLFPGSLEAPVARQLLKEKQYFAVQVGAFVERSRAEALAAELTQKREYAYIVETLDQNARKFYRVRVGQLTMLKDAQNLRIHLGQLGYPAQIYP
jgi:outer membrane protein assembly factor BamD (BamD/ComL family)